MANCGLWKESEDHLSGPSNISSRASEKFLHHVHDLLVGTCITVRNATGYVYLGVWTRGSNESEKI